MSDTNGSGGASRAPGADDVPAGDAWTAPVPEAGDHGLRRRRVLIVAVLVVVVAGVTVFVAGQGRPVRSTPAASATPVSAPTVAPDRLDPTRQLFRLGFLPGSAGDTSYLSEADTHTVRVVGPGGRTPGAREDGGSSSSSTWAVEVGMAARGIDVHREAREYASELGHDVPGDSVAPVHGRPAFRYETGGTSVLSWQYAPDGWMWVRVTDVDRPAEVARQVAEGVVWETAPLAVPFQAVELPSGAVLAGAHLRWHEGRWLEARARYLLGRPEGNTSFVRPDLVVGVSAKSLAYGRCRRRHRGRPCRDGLRRGERHRGGLPGGATARQVCRLRRGDQDRDGPGLQGGGRPGGRAGPGGLDPARGRAREPRPVAPPVARRG